MNSPDLPREQCQSTTLLVSKKPNPRGDGILSALDPTDGGEWDLRVSVVFMERCRGISHGELLTLAKTVPHACSQPTRIYQGVRSEAEGEWLCYCAQPPVRFTKTGNEVPPNDDDIFLVFVNSDRRIYSFQWEKTPHSNSGIPSNCHARFQRKVYP